LYHHLDDLFDFHYYFHQMMHLATILEQMLAVDLLLVEELQVHLIMYLNSKTTEKVLRNFSLDKEKEIFTGLCVSVSCPFGDVPSADDGSGADQYFNQELLVGFVDSVADGTVDENNSFHVEARCVRVLDDVKRGVAVPNTDDQTEFSSLVGCRCCSFIVDITANGFCTCVVNDTVGL
jgi:hypothetical protein